MPRNVVYGKRRNVGCHFTSTDFFDSSSPAGIETAEENKPSYPNSSYALKKDSSVIDILADQFQDLAVEKDGTSDGLHKDRQVVENGVLADGDGNNSAIRVASNVHVMQSTSDKENTTDNDDLPPKNTKQTNTRRFVRSTRKENESQAISADSTSRRRSQSLPELKKDRKLHESVNRPVPRSVTEYLQPLIDLKGESAEDCTPSSYAEWANSLSSFFNISKIAEASYGEVYRLSLKSRKAGFGKSDESVLKIIPLKPNTTQPCENAKAKSHLMSEIADVANEVRLLQRMTHVPGFTNFREIRVMQGRPPPQFVAAWKSWNSEQCRQKKSQFPDPSRKASYSESQLWAVIEMQDAGTDLESRPCTDVWSAWDVFWSVTVALAKGEEGARFEHRDLHLGNICVKSTRRDGSKHPIIRPNMQLGYTGLETTIIDYTISRADMNDHPNGDKRDEEFCEVAYYDLSKDPAIFEGDSTEEYQYDIYRYMRAAVFYDDPMSESSAPDTSPSSQPALLWRKYNPLTNAIWLHFLLYKITEQIEVWPSCDPEPEEDQGGEIAVDIEEKLLEIQKALKLERMRDGTLRSATDLVEWALENGWLDVGDVVGSGNETELA